MGKTHYCFHDTPESSMSGNQAVWFYPQIKTCGLHDRWVKHIIASMTPPSPACQGTKQFTCTHKVMYYGKLRSTSSDQGHKSNGAEGNFAQATAMIDSA